MNHVQWNKKMCGKWITVKNTKNGKTARGYVEDLCPDCGYKSLGELPRCEDVDPCMLMGALLDLSPSVFKQMAPLSQGVINIDWVVSRR